MLGMRARERGDSMTCCHHTWTEVRWARPSHTLCCSRLLLAVLADAAADGTVAGPGRPWSPRCPALWRYLWAPAAAASPGLSLLSAPVRSRSFG